MTDVSGALKNPGSSFAFSEALEFEPCEIMGDVLRFEDAALSGLLFGAEETVSIDAELNVTVRAHCARCLEEVACPMRVQVKADFSRAPGEDEYPIAGHLIDAGKAAFDELLTQLPMRFLCKEDCLGLCPVCGSNRNKSLCTCLEGAVRPNPFSALNVLLHDQNNKEV
ncbi:MAG: DUF177 domain-containing protein [Clostridia bacterium]|nr:DUF177 domain-containing protein [Clostridia bacterium]